MLISLTQQNWMKTWQMLLPKYQFIRYQVSGISSSDTYNCLKVFWFKLNMWILFKKFTTSSFVIHFLLCLFCCSFLALSMDFAMSFFIHWRDLSDISDHHSLAPWATVNVVISCNQFLSKNHLSIIAKHTANMSMMCGFIILYSI